MSSQLNQDLEKLEAKETSLFDLTFRDNEGKIVIAQAPNLPLLLGLGAFFLQVVLPSGKIGTTLDLVSFGALFTWAWLEIFEGVNYFRRGLGLIVLLSIIVLRVNISGV